MAGVYSKKALIAIGGMFIFGTGTMVAAKMMLLESSVGRHPEDGEKDFEKPWYQTTIMFFAMSICILWHLISVSLEKRALAKKKGLLAGEDKQLIEEAPKNDPKAYFYIAIPALFDLLATTVMTYGLIYIDVSVMQMLRGSMVVFSAILSVLILKRKLYAFNWVGVCYCVFACACVGTSSVMGAPDTVHTAGERLFGCTLVIISQFIQAMQIVSEDLLLHNINAAPLQIVGMEGVWGAILCCCVFLPGAYILSGSDNGHMEDTIDTIKMVQNNHTILVTSAVYFVSILFLNYAGMTVTSELTAVHRTMFEAMRTLCIWLTNLSINYFIFPNTVFGEKWNAWSPLQTAGFLTLIFSTFFYNAMVRFKLFKYPSTDNVEEETDNKA